MTLDLQRLDAPPLFILGTAGSGAAWVYEFLTQHPAVAGVRESWVFAEPDVGDGRARSETLLADALGDSHRYVVERSSPHVFHIDAIATAWPEARFLHVLRDGRDVALKVNATALKWPPGWAEVFGDSVQSAGAAWARSVEAVLSTKRALGDRFLEVRFEKLNLEHFDVGRQILEFAGIDYTVDFILEALAANDRRLDLPEPSDPWKTNFSLWGARRFHKVAGQALVRTYYAEDDKWWFRPLKQG